MLNPSAIGAEAERRVAMALIDAGVDVFVPLFCAHARVDLVIVDADGAKRVQCKTSHLVDGAVQFGTCSNTGNERKAYRGEIDFFGVWSPELGAAFLVPVGITALTMCRLRVEAARSNQVKGLHFAADYRVPPVAT